MENIIGSIIMSILAILCILISYRQFKEKGFLFNNAYIFASKEERESMDRTPHYKQSGIVFLLMGITSLIIAVDVIIKTSWLYYCELAIIAGMIVYAIVSSVKIEKRTK
ncbi:MAG: DUF3784 domain-containing protein [Hespellia sp.]|nr:DUF3784 domain-containing protein [Hespellia sp.]